jgi:hypothetical protein
MPRTIIANGYAGDLAVPLWGRFMQTATRGDNTDRFAMPATVVPVTICRLSGKLATDACQSSVVFDSDGNPTDRSMVYTEYFVRGTEPLDYCPLHTRGFDAVATSASSTTGSSVVATGGNATPPLQPVDHLKDPVPPNPDTHIGDKPPSTADPAAAATTTAPAAGPRRGFWGRLFRR